MKKILKYIFVALAASSSLTSCSDEWLETKPLSFYSPENVLVDEAGYTSMLVTLRKSLKNDTFHRPERWNPISTQQYQSADIAITSMRTNKAAKDLQTQLLPTGDGNSLNFYKLWDFAYEFIKTANIVISRIDDTEWEDESVRNKILSEAYFFRTYWYNRLVNYFGDVPFVNGEVTSAKLDFYSHSRWTILDKLVEDMKFAAANLPVSADPGAPTQGAGYHLLAKVCLANCDFDGAIDAASKVIDSPKYKLMTSRFGVDAGIGYHDLMWDLFRSENINVATNTETILATVDRYDDLASRSNGCFKGKIFAPQYWNALVKDSQGKTGGKSTDVITDTLMAGNGDARPLPYFIYTIWADGIHTWKNTPDMRRADNNWLDKEELVYTNPASVDYGKPLNPSYFKNDTIQFYFSSPRYKYYYPMQDKSLVPSGGNGDSYLYRLAETYLVRAEANYWKGNKSAAAADINVVRERAKALPVSEAQVDIDYIFDERARELYTEEMRRDELTRVSYVMAKLGVDGYNLEKFSSKNFYYDRCMRVNDFYRDGVKYNGQLYRIAPFNVLFPVPATVINANSKGVINQNEGYNGYENNVPVLTTIDELEK